MGALSGLSPVGSIAIGIVVGLLSTSVQSLGLTLQRKSHMLEDEKGPLDVRRPPHRRRRWQLGMGMFVVANVLGSSVQISTLPLPVLSTLQAAGLVFNSICASLILGEPFTRWSLWGTLLVCGGAILIATFGAIPSPAHSLRELLELMARWQFIVWMALQGLLVVAMAAVVDVVGHFSNLRHNARWRLFRGLAYGCISGVLSAHSLLFAKSAVELILRTIADSDNQFVHWQAWIIVLGLVTLALTQLYYLHRGLKLVSTSVLYPLVFCIYNIIAILDGLIYFNQTNLINPLRGGIIALGTVVLLSGVLALSWRLDDEQHGPSVGQSTLAPGLGLVDDTDGEEDSLLDSDIASDEEAPVPRAYNTFMPNLVFASPSTPGHKRPTSWAESREIWDALEDQDTPTSPPALIRSLTLPSGETTALLGGQRLPSNLSTASNSMAAQSSESTPGKMFKRRRKSTGFPGFQARKAGPERRKNSVGGIQDALGGAWKMRWFGRPRGASESAVEGGSSTSQGPPGRTDEEAGMGGVQDRPRGYANASFESEGRDEGASSNDGGCGRGRGRRARRHDAT